MLTLVTLEGALAVSAASITVNRGSITLGLRDWLRKERVPVITGLVNCPYCLSHWFALAVAWRVAPIYLNDASSWFDFVVQAACVVGISAPLIGAAYKLLHWDEAELTRLRGEIVKLEDQLTEAEDALRDLTAAPSEEALNELINAN